MITAANTLSSQNESNRVDKSDVQNIINDSEKGGVLMVFQILKIE